MERRNFAALCAAVLCFWLFALAFGTAQGMGLHLVARREAKTASAQAVWVEPALPAAAAPALSLNCRAAILIEQDSGRVLYEKNAEEKMPIASITKVMTLLLTADGQVAYLREAYPQLEDNIIEDDFLKMNLQRLFDGQPFVLTGNYPYNISSQIFFKMLDNKEEKQ